jgi:hypothetical protein
MDARVVFPKSFTVRFLTNNAAGENEWTLFDENDMPVVSNTPLSNATVHYDTISNLPPGCYRFTIKDYGCNGINWWAAPSAGAGNLRFNRYDMSGIQLYMFPYDFGCSFTKYFTVLPDPPPPVDTTAVKQSLAEISSIDVFPNPAADLAYLKIDLATASKASYKITDITGKVLKQKDLGQVDGIYEKIDISAYQSGVYVVKVSLEDGSSVTRKLVVQN